LELREKCTAQDAREIVEIMKSRLVCMFIRKRTTFYNLHLNYL